MKWSVGIRFPKVKTSWGRDTVYHYLSDKAIALNSTVVVDSPYDGLTCVKVISCEAWRPGSKATKWIVDIVDQHAHNSRALARERMDEIEKKLNSLADFMKQDDWRMLRKVNAEARMFYAEYKELQDQINGY